MGYYYQDQPSGRPGCWSRFTPGPLRRLWQDTAEVALVTRAVFSLILPVIGLFVVFLVVFMLLLALLGSCSR